MDDAQTYLLNGLLARQFGLGRIVRFRQVERGRQAVTYELLTAQQNEYFVYLFSPGFSASALSFAAGVLGVLDENRFTVVPFLRSRQETFTAEGPQRTTLMVSVAPVGSPLAPEQYSEHDVSQVGLRLAWMHRLLGEQLKVEAAEESLRERVRAIAAIEQDIGPLMSLLDMPVAQGWAHGDISAAALLHDGDHQLRTVMDWSLLHVGSPLEDVVDAFLAFCLDGGGRPLAVQGRALMEAYHSLIPVKRIPWTPVVASWLAWRLVDAAAGRRSLPRGFEQLLAKPENLATALASCLV